MGVIFMMKVGILPIVVDVGVGVSVASLLPKSPLLSLVAEAIEVGVVVLLFPSTAVGVLLGPFDGGVIWRAYAVERPLKKRPVVITAAIAMRARSGAITRHVLGCFRAVWLAPLCTVV